MTNKNQIDFKYICVCDSKGFPGCSNGKESACQGRLYRFDYMHDLFHLSLSYYERRVIFLFYLGISCTFIFQSFLRTQYPNFFMCQQHRHVSFLLATKYQFLVMTLLKAVYFLGKTSLSNCVASETIKLSRIGNLLISRYIQLKRTSVNSLQEILYLKEDHRYLGHPRRLNVKNPLANAGGMSSISGSRGSIGEGHDNPLQYSCPKNPMDRGA